jgi:predicted transcriptional regulator of viral defense system
MNLTWDEAVLHVLGNHHPHEVSLQTIYFEVRKYRKLTEEDSEVTKYGEPRYQHIVRATLTSLAKGGFVERIRRGMYVLRE